MSRTEKKAVVRAVSQEVALPLPAQRSRDPEAGERVPGRGGAGWQLEGLTTNSTDGQAIIGCVCFKLTELCLHQLSSGALSEGQS